MADRPAAPTSTSQPPAAAVETPPAAGSSARMLVMLGLLVVLIGWYSYDYFVAKPATLAADLEIQKLADERNKQGIRSADGKKLGDGRVTSADIQKLLGRAPSSTKKESEYTVECYWWYSMPHRNYVSVLYVGNEPRRYDTHYLDRMPPPDVLPTKMILPPPAAIPANAETGDGKVAPSAASEGAAKTEPGVEGEKPSADSDKASSIETTPADSEKPAAEKSSPE